MSITKKIKFLTEKAALKELDQKYDLNINLDYSKLDDLLLSIYHFGYSMIKENVKPEYKEAFLSVSQEDWHYYVNDLNALLSQLTTSNYKILLNDIKK